MIRRITKRIGKSDEVVKVLKEIQKKQDKMESSIVKIQRNLDLKPIPETDAKETWAKQFLKDENIELVQAVIAGTGIVTGGYSLAKMIVDNNLDDQQKETLIRNTRTDYVTIEHRDNNQLITEYYQKSESINLLHVEKVKDVKHWYQFWR